jgi:hypothetical protein
MESSPNPDIRSVIAAPAHALSAKQILIMVLSLCGGLIVFDFFYYLGVIFEGQAPRLVFEVYGFLPFATDGFQSTVARGLYYTGAVFGVFVLMLGFFGVSAIHIEALRGNRFFSARGALKFTLNRWRQVAYAEGAIILFVLFITLLYIIFGLICRIPFIGEWIYSIFFIIPNFIIGLFAVFILFILALSILLLPAVAAAERNGEAFNVILETFSTIIREPFRWIGYTLYALVAAKVVSFVFCYFAYRAVQFTTWASSLGGGEGIEKLVRGGLSHLPTRSDFVQQACNIFPGIHFGFSLPQGNFFLTSTSVASNLMALMLFLIFATVVGYALATVAGAQARGYALIRFIKDGYRIDEEKSMFASEEHVNPPVEGRESAG